MPESAPRPAKPAPEMDQTRAESILRALDDAHPYPAMVIDSVLIALQRHHGHAVVNAVIDSCDLSRRFGIRKVWPDAPAR